MWRCRSPLSELDDSFCAGILARPEGFFRALPECGDRCLRLYSSRQIDLMKLPPNDAASGSRPEQPYESIFSLLLEIEKRLRAEARADSFQQAGRRKTTKRALKRPPGVKILSRYVE
jgi:hypothetical protein